MCSLLDMGECLDSQEQVNATQLHSWVHARSDRHHQRDGQFLALLTEEVLNRRQSVLGRVVTDHATIDVVVTLAKEHRGRTGVTCNLPNRIYKKLIKHKNNIYQLLDL